MAFTVADCFLIRGVGLLIEPGAGGLDPPLRVGDRLRLVRPNGSEVSSAVQALYLLHGPEPAANPFLALPGLQPEDVPPGTAVWVGSAAEPGATHDGRGVGATQGYRPPRPPDR